MKGRNRNTNTKQNKNNLLLTKKLEPIFEIMTKYYLLYFHFFFCSSFKIKIKIKIKKEQLRILNLDLNSSRIEKNKKKYNPPSNNI